MTDIIKHDFNGSITVTQRKFDGYVNLTELAAIDSDRPREVYKYLNSKRGKDYIKLLSVETQICVSDLSQVDKTSTDQATWGHLELAIDMAHWISPKFALQANRVLRQVMSGEFLPVTQEAEKSAIVLADQFADICNQLSATHYELEGFRQTAKQFAEMLGKERANRLEWMRHTLNALHSATSDEQIETMIGQLRREIAVITARKEIEATQNSTDLKISTDVV